MAVSGVGKGSVLLAIEHVSSLGWKKCFISPVFYNCVGGEAWGSAESIRTQPGCNRFTFSQIKKQKKGIENELNTMATMASSDGWCELVQKRYSSGPRALPKGYDKWSSFITGTIASEASANNRLGDSATVAQFERPSSFDSFPAGIDVCSIVHFTLPKTVFPVPFSLLPAFWRWRGNMNPSTSDCWK